MGVPVARPILVAPTAMHGSRAPTATRDARAAAAADSIMVRLDGVVGSRSTRSRQPRPARDSFAQMYMLRDRGQTRALAERAPRAVAWRSWPRSTARRCPHGAAVRAERGDALPDTVIRLVDDFDPSVTFDDLARFGEWSGLPVVVKGVIRGDDARRCVDAGAGAIAVSNHGGRIVDGCVDTASALVDVVDAVRDRAEILVDGGIRSGTDVLRALALGAHAVMLGRPVLWGLAIDGESGARAVLDAFARDLRRTMAFCGAASLAGIDRDLLAC